MAIIPAGSKVMTVASTVDTNERKSTQANSPTQYYSIEDITETATVYDNGTSGLTATTMQDAIDEVSANVDALPAAPTTTTVNISSAQILAMGSTPIELLPAAGVGKYYDDVKVILEYTHGTTNYSLGGDLINVRSEDNYKYIALTNIGALQNENRATTLILRGSDVDGVNGFVQGGWRAMNKAIVLDTYNNTNPTLGDGTLRAIITYTTRTFGA